LFLVSTGDFDMGSLAEVMASVSDGSFRCKEDAQKYLIEFILFHSNYDLKSLAEILDVNPLFLSHVAMGKSYLDGNGVSKLINWFLILISQ